MQPWKISIGLTAIILAVALMLAGESFAYLKPYFWNHRNRLLDARRVVWRSGRGDASGHALLRRSCLGAGRHGPQGRSDGAVHSARRGRANRACRETGTRGPGAVSRSLTHNNPTDTEGSMNTNNLIIWKRGALLASVLALSAGELMAQGTSPWLQAIDVLQASLHRTHCARTELDCHRGGRAHVRLW